MGESSFRRISEGELKGRVREDLYPRLPSAFFKDPVSTVRQMEGEVLKESRLRWAAFVPLSKGEKIFLKRDLTKGWFESLKYLFLPSKGKKEWSIARQLEERGLSIPAPLGWMEKVHSGFVRESYYLSEAVGSGVSILDALGSGESLDGSRFAKHVRAIHDSGFFHKDFHAGNFLQRGDTFFLTDLHRARIVKHLSDRQRVLSLSQLFHSLRSYWGGEEQGRFMEEYLGGEPLAVRNQESLLRRILSTMERLQKRQWKSRTKRCLKESTDFSVQREKGMTLYRRRDFAAGLAKKAVEEHLSLVKKESVGVVKNSPEVAVSLLRNGERGICVKQFRYPGLWNRFKERVRGSTGLRAWIAGNGLRTRGVPVPEPLALVEVRKRGWRESFFAMEALEPGQELDRSILKGWENLEGKKRFVQTFARWLSRLHQMNLYHKDMKACNIVVLRKAGRWDFYLLDLEDVRLDGKVNEKKLFRNLLQLNTSIPKSLSRTDRLRFLKAYLRMNPIVRDTKRFVHRLGERSKERGIVYLSPEGVVEDKL